MTDFEIRAPIFMPALRGVHRCNPPGTDGPQPWERK